MISNYTNSVRWCINLRDLISISCKRAETEYLCVFGGEWGGNCGGTSGFNE